MQTTSLEVRLFDSDIDKKLGLEKTQEIVSQILRVVQDHDLGVFLFPAGNYFYTTEMVYRKPIWKIHPKMWKKYSLREYRKMPKEKTTLFRKSTTKEAWKKRSVEEDLSLLFYQDIDNNAVQLANKFVKEDFALELPKMLDSLQGDLQHKASTNQRIKSGLENADEILRNL